VSRTPQRLIVVFCLVRLEQRNIAAHQLICRIDVTENLRPCCIAGLLAAVDIDQRAFLFTLILVEDAQWDTHADANVSGPLGLLVEELWVYQPL